MKISVKLWISVNTAPGPTQTSARSSRIWWMRCFLFRPCRRDTRSALYCPPANVCLLSNAPPADWHVTQVSGTPAFRKPCHAGEEPEPARRFQVPGPTIWDAKGSHSRFQLELSTGTSTTFAEWILSCRLMAVMLHVDLFVLPVRHGVFVLASGRPPNSSCY